MICVLISGSVFMLRGLLMLTRSRFTNYVVLRYGSYAVDSVLLVTALLLMGLLHQYPFTHAWLAVKVVSLIGYIVLGTFALKRGRSRRVQIICYFAALSVFLFIASVARAHHPLGVFHTFID